MTKITNMQTAQVTFTAEVRIPVRDDDTPFTREEFEEIVNEAEKALFLALNGMVCHIDRDADAYVEAGDLETRWVKFPRS